MRTCYKHRELSLALCDDLEGRDGGWWQGGDVCGQIANSLHCTAETNSTLPIPQLTTTKKVAIRLYIDIPMAGTSIWYPAMVMFIHSIVELLSGSTTLWGDGWHKVKTALIKILRHYLVFSTVLTNTLKVRKQGWMSLLTQ